AGSSPLCRGLVSAPPRRRPGPGPLAVTTGSADAVTITGLQAPLAQLAEQRTLNPRVRGSSPWRRTRSEQQILANSGWAFGSGVERVHPLLPLTMHRIHRQQTPALIAMP